MRNELQTVMMAARELPAGELPRLLGELEEIRCTAMARLTAPAPVQSQADELLNAAEAARRLGELEEIRCTAMARLTAPAPVQSQADELLNAAEAARRLGISQDYLYRHHCDFPFTRRVGRRLLFSALGIEKYIKTTTRRDSKTSAALYLSPVVNRTTKRGLHETAD